MGAVTTPPTAPESASPTAVSIQRKTIWALAAEGCPETTGPCTGRSSTGRPEENTAAASRGDPTRLRIAAPAGEAAASN